MQKDFKIGLAIGAVIVAGAVIWLATLPNLSARARAIQAASNITPSQKTSSIVSQLIPSPQPADSETITSAEPRTMRDESQVMPAPSDESRPVLHSDSGGGVTSNEATQRIHVVQKGDTLSSISAKYFGSSRQWRKIVLANRDNLPDPNRLSPGTKLIIPQ